jgi:adenylate kinase
MLDGYPRTVEQAVFLTSLLRELQLPQPMVVHIDVPAQLLITRTCNRRYCAQCGSIYNLASHPPKDAGLCNTCHIELQQRADDCEDTVRNRLVSYEKSTAPLIEFYRSGSYVRIDGTSTPDTVFDEIRKSLS